MSLEEEFAAIPIGFDLGEVEIVLDEKTVGDRAAVTQWQALGVIEKFKAAPPGQTIEIHPRMQFAKFTGLRSAIWAKSEHEFLKPLKMGSTVIIRGRVVDKYIKRGRFYRVSEFETVDENGEILMRSRETGIHVE
ncbi:MAG: hypothetical protein JXA41_04395 [Deltaproteobacteria bacterium]|nr:hypothetical protein [Deltaproteobacteria bacterium]